MTSEGEDRYRRGIYTFIKRTAPYPAFLSFDATSREFCTVRRVRTNTPLQALTTLNDPVFFEAAVALARRMVIEAGPDASARATHGFRLCTSRRPSPAELSRILALYNQELAHFGQNGAAAEAVLKGRTVPPGITPAELSAWTIVANVLLNLDEAVTRE